MVMVPMVGRIMKSVLCRFLWAMPEGEVLPVRKAACTLRPWHRSELTCEHTLRNEGKQQQCHKDVFHSSALTPQTPPKIEMGPKMHKNVSNIGSDRFRGVVIRVNIPFIVLAVGVGASLFAHPCGSVPLQMYTQTT
eukprot:5490586-Amphidinium_carterae.1